MGCDRIDLITQMDIFYHSMNYVSKGVIDVACCGAFKRKSAKEERQLIEDLAKCNLLIPNDIYKFMILLPKDYYLIPSNVAKNLLRLNCIMWSLYANLLVCHIRTF